MRGIREESKMIKAKDGIVKCAAAFVLVVVAFCGMMPKALGEDRAALKGEVQQLYKETRAFRELFQKSVKLVLPSVVSITTERKVRMRNVPQIPFPFRRPFSPRNDQERNLPGRQPDLKVSGLGSGFVIDPSGYIVTNCHVVEGLEAKDIKVVFGNGKEYVPTKVWRDEKTDIAVVKIDAKNLPALEWGEARTLAAGEWVLAIGSPLGFGNTATSGIVSATSTKNRWFAGGRPHDFAIIREKTGYAIEDYIQTEAAINPGNSGGPLVRLTGEVVGINTAIVSPSRVSAGLGFAVPEKIARSVVRELIQHGKVVRGHLGVLIISSNELTDQAAMRLFRKHNADEVREEYHLLKTDKGVLVASLVPGAPAEKAGIEVGDLIIAVDNTPTLDADVLKSIIADKRPGTRVTVTLRRKGREKKIEVTLGEQPTVAVAALTQGEAGLSVQTLTPDVAAFLGYDKNLKGVVVTGITRGSPADKAGLQLRDVIQRVNKTPVPDKRAFQGAMRAAGGKGVSLDVKRGKQDMLILLKP